MLIDLILRQARPHLISASLLYTGVATLGCESAVVNTNEYLGDRSPLAMVSEDMNVERPQGWFVDQGTAPSTMAGATALMAGEAGPMAGEAGPMAGFVEGGGAPEGGAPPIGPATPIETLVSQVNGSLELITNLPVTVSDCDERLLIGLSCGDQDGDGLVDQWEDALLESLKPVFRFHVDEPILQDSSPSLLQLGRVSASQSSPDVFLHIVTLFDRAEGLCLAFPETRGDLELVVIRLSAQASGAYRVTGGLLPPRALTGWRTFEAPTTVISDPQVGARWVIYSIKNQHTLYLDRDHCTRSTSVCGDLCGPNSAGASSYDRLVEIINVGEPARPLVTGLDSLGYPNEQVWRGGHFCGGASQSRSVICADSSIVELLNRPFGG